MSRTHNVYTDTQIVIHDTHTKLEVYCAPKKFTPLKVFVWQILYPCDHAPARHFQKVDIFALNDKISQGWNVIVGKKFGGFYVHRRGNMANFKIGGTYFLVFNSRKIRLRNKRPSLRR